MEANSKRDIWEIKKKNISFGCDTKFSQNFPKYQRLELFFENILVLFLDAIGSLPPIPGLQYTCHTDICHPDWTSGSPFVTHRYFLIFILYVSLGVQSIFLWDGVRLPEKVHTYRVVFWLVPPRKVLSMELVPPNSEKMTKFIGNSNISTKKVKVQVRACQTPNFVAKLQQKVKVSQTLTWIFTFLVGIFAISSELSHLSFLGEPSQKKPPCIYFCAMEYFDHF